MDPNNVDTLRPKLNRIYIFMQFLLAFVLHFVNSEAARLHDVAKSGNSFMLLASGCCGGQINAWDNQGFTPLHYAYNARVASMLISRGASIDKMSENKVSPIMQAMMDARYDVVRVLAAAGADVLNCVHPETGDSVIHLAAEQAVDSGFVEVFVKCAGVEMEGHSSDIWLNADSQSPIDVLIASGSATDVLKLKAMLEIVPSSLIHRQDYAGLTLLHQIVRDGCAECVDMYLKFSDVNYANQASNDGQTALSMAIQKLYMKSSPAFVASRNSARRRTMSLTTSDTSMEAASDMSNSLHGSDDQSNVEQTEEDLILFRSSFEAIIFKLLSLEGIDVNTVPDYGISNLMIAIQNSDARLVVKLLKCGAILPDLPSSGQSWEKLLENYGFSEETVDQIMLHINSISALEESAMEALVSGHFQRFQELYEMSDEDNDLVESIITSQDLSKTMKIQALGYIIVCESNHNLLSHAIKVATVKLEDTVLQFLKWIQNESIKDADIECPVCYEPKVNYVSKCNHGFCIGCVTHIMSTKRHARCPSCREPMFPGEE